MPKAKKRKGKKDQAVSAAVLAGLKPTVSSHRSKSKKAKSSDSSSSGSSSDSDDKDKEKEPTPTALGTEKFDSEFLDLDGQKNQINPPRTLAPRVNLHRKPRLKKAVIKTMTVCLHTSTLYIWT